MAAVRILKLVSGDDVIGIIDEAEVDGGKKVLSLKAPCYVMMRVVDKEQDEYALGLAPYMPYAMNSVIGIVPRHVISVCDPNDQLMELYKQRFEKGIIKNDDPSVKQVLKEG